MEITPLTPEQQLAVDVSFNKRFADINAKAEVRIEDAVKERTAKLEAELSTLRLAKDNGKDNGKDDSAVVERIAAVEKKWRQANERAAREHLKSIAAEMNAINAEQVAALIGGDIRLDDDGHPSVVNAEGKTRMNADNKQMSVKELVSEFLSANAHFVKASGTTGSGSQGAKTGGSGGKTQVTRMEFDAMSLDERMKTARLPGVVFTD